MLTSQDIKKLADYLKESFKDTFATKENFYHLDEKISTLQTSADVIARGYKN